MFKVNASNRGYIPALSFHSLTPFYDPLLQWVMQEDRFKQMLVEQAGVDQGQRVLDLGCGTGTLTRMLQYSYPTAQITGLDIDSAILALAQRKAGSLPIQWIRGAATELPLPSDSYDRILTSLTLHHLTTADKQRALDECIRVLRPGGQLHVVDFGPPRSPYAHIIALLMRHLEEVADNLDGGLPLLFMEAGFTTICESTPLISLFGNLYLHALEKPLAPT
ncbi:MAG: methyltransferase domain-containing protein [Caldilineaceae bacterium]|nr:methyltransferase domain-containing protein [Caldilineaceae bacterium]